MSDTKPHNSRLATYKKAGGTTATVQDKRRKWAEIGVSVRKQARDEQLLKCRALSPEANNVVDEKVMTPFDIVQGLKKSNLLIKTSAARAAREMLSGEENPPISIMVEAGVIKPLVAALDRDDCPDLQFEACWALTNIASGSHEHTMAVVDGKAIRRLVALVGRGGTLGKQSAWALGNIAGDGAGARDAVLAAGALPALLPLLAGPASLTTTTIAVWTYRNLCRSKNPIVDFDLVAPALPYISELLTSENSDVLAYACQALLYLTDGPDERIERVQTVPKLLRRLVKLLGHKASAVRLSALRALGNMLTGTDAQTDRCLDAKCVRYIKALLECGKPALVKEAARASSNILAGTPAHIDRALAVLLPPLLVTLVATDVKCQKEAAWAITNLCVGGTLEQQDQLIATGGLELLCQLLDAADPSTIVVVLDGLTSLLQKAAKYSQVEALCLKLEEIAALDKIEALYQHHENELIYKKTEAILDTYFAEQEDATEPQQTEQKYKFLPDTEGSINSRLN